MEMLVPALAISGLTFGPYLTRLAYQNYRDARRMAEIETTPTREVRPNSKVEVSGVITPGEATATAPVSERDAVVCVWRVDTWTEFGSTNLWRPSAIGVSSVPFTVQDEFGEVTVDAGSHVYDLGGSSLSGTALKGLSRLVSGQQDSVKTGFVNDSVSIDMHGWEDVFEVGPEERPPASIRRFIEQTDAVDPASGSSVMNILDIGKKHGRRRYREAILGPGDDCYVLGPTDSTGRLSSSAGKLWLGPRSEEELLAKKRKRYRRGGPVGVGASLLGLVATGMLL